MVKTVLRQKNENRLKQMKSRIFMGLTSVIYTLTIVNPNEIDHKAVVIKEISSGFLDGYSLTALLYRVEASDNVCGSNRCAPKNPDWSGECQIDP